MSTSTLRPDGVNAAGSGWVAQTGGPSWATGGTANGNTADNSDSTRVIQNSGAGGYATALVLTFGTVAIPTLAQVRSVTARLRLATQDTCDNGMSVGARSKVGSAERSEVGLSYTIVPDNIIINASGPAQTTNPAGTAWTQADIDALMMMLYGSPFSGVFGGSCGENFQVYEAYYDVVYNEAPVGTATGPSGAVTTTSQPTVSWTYADPESDAQERYRVKVFTAAQYGAGGFNPETSPAAWDSLEQFSAAARSVVVGPLANTTTYRAYVKVADVGSGGRYSAWSFIGFNIAVTAPPTPTLTATDAAALARVQLVATHGTFGSTQTFVIERSTDGGATWSTIRAADGRPPSSGSTLTVYDYELPRGVPASYRAHTAALVGGFVLASPNSSSATVTLGQTGWWLKDPLDPTKNIQPDVLPSFSVHRKEPQQIYEPLGRTTSVVVTDGVRGAEGTIEMWAKTGARYARLEALVTSGRTLFLEDVLGRTWYVKFGAASEWKIIRAIPTPSETTPIRHLHQVSVPFTEVSAPTGVPTDGTPTFDPPDIGAGSYGYIGGY